jgi:DNA-binding transcriptional LysR family regulator
MNFTLNQLRIFQKVSQTLSITKAAEALHLTQPAVSIQLKNFQEQLELPLLEIVNKKIYITDFGREIATLADKIIADVHSIQFKHNAHLGQLTGQLKVSSVSTGKYIAPYFLSDFIQLHQGVELMLDVTNKSKVIESLEKNEVDFALVSVLPDNLRIEKHQLLDNKLFLVGDSATNKVAKIYDKKIFDDLPLIYREKGSGTRHVMEKYLIKNNIYVKKTMELTSNEAVKQAVLAGLGYSIMPLIGIKTELDSNLLKIIPVKGFPIQSKWSLIWLKDKKLSIAAQAYIEYIKNEKGRIIESKFGWCNQYI